MEVYQVGRNSRTQPREKGLEEVLLCKWNNLCSFLHNMMQGNTCLPQRITGSGSVGLRGSISSLPFLWLLPSQPSLWFHASHLASPAPLLPLGDAFLPGRLWRPPVAAHSSLSRPCLSSTFLWFNDQLMAPAPQGTVWQEGEGVSPYSA